MKRSMLIFLMLIATGSVFGQGRGGGGRGAPPTGKPAAPFDATGYWVSLVGEDWRWRMFPNKGDYGAAPLNAEARKIADSWDPAKDVAAGEQCKGYAAPVVMRVPGRLHVTWQDDQTLKIETDAGQQTRLFHFGTPSQAQSEGWQGVSKAEPRARRRDCVELPKSSGRFVHLEEQYPASLRAGVRRGRRFPLDLGAPCPWREARPPCRLLGRPGRPAPRTAGHIRR